MALAFVLLVLPVAVAPASASGFPCVDDTGDGACGEGDTDITASLQEGFVSVTGDVLVPAGVQVIVKTDLAVFTSGTITVLGKLKGTTLSMGADGGIVVGERGTVEGRDYLDLSAGGAITLGSKASAQSGAGSTFLLAWGGGIAVGPGGTVGGRDGLDMTALGGGVSAVETNLLAPNGALFITGSADVVVSGAVIKAQSVVINTDASLLDLSHTMVKLKGQDTAVSLSTGGSTVDLRGAKFMRLDPASLYIDAETILQ
jgi:hypothetical protein